MIQSQQKIFLAITEMDHQSREIVGEGPFLFACNRGTAQAFQPVNFTAIAPLVVDGGNHGEESHDQILQDAYLNSFPPGYRFTPSDCELIICYLRKKVLGQPLPPNKIREVELYKYSPDYLADKYEPLGKNEWYFFTPRDRKYRNGKRPNRTAENGYWRATIADKPIYSTKYPLRRIGSKRSLVYYRGKARQGYKTDWIMHEYEDVDAPKKEIGGNDMRLDCVLCRIRRKSDESSKAAAEAEERCNASQGIEAQQQQQQAGAPVPANFHYDPGNLQQASFKNPSLSPNEPPRPDFGGNGDMMSQPIKACPSHNNNMQLTTNGWQADHELPPLPEFVGFQYEQGTISTENSLIFDYDDPFAREMFGDALPLPVPSGDHLPAPSGC